MDGRRNKERRKLSLVDAEIFLLEKERDKETRTLLEIESPEEIKNRIKLKRPMETKSAPAVPISCITQKTLHSLNQLFFEMCNLPMEYILMQSNKIVLTSEWRVSIVEKEWIERLKEIKKLLDKKILLEETDNQMESNIERTKREIEKQEKKKKEYLRGIFIAMNQIKREKSIFKEIYTGHVQEDNKKNLQEKYTKLLSLFSLMKSNKSSVRINIPQSKKSSSSMHSSHAACIEKLRAEYGKITTIPELAKYRQCKKASQEKKAPSGNPNRMFSINLHKTNKYTVPIIYANSQNTPSTQQKKDPEDERDNDSSQ
ncbi:hypothetical protein NEFER03_2114 [Nematocida sp. LUAm3]|nr:hypothetical protein NEFER03_2114 [Nematocida sp. LUAm3]KAI5175634.1 hypothetical protein NEFER02_1521 [Nematocida sp. LUAm2]KAI5178540.1 hypothetical protein NEFER01_1676 [Nematocida sp. LUAm1]